MGLDAYIALSIRVLTDWRVIACAVAVLVIWTLFRFVGVIAQRRPPYRGGPRQPPPSSRPPGR